MLASRVPSVHPTVSFLWFDPWKINNLLILACGIFASMGPRNVYKDMLKIWLVSLLVLAWITKINSDKWQMGPCSLQYMWQFCTCNSVLYYSRDNCYEIIRICYLVQIYVLIVFMVFYFNQICMPVSLIWHSRTPISLLLFLFLTASHSHTGPLCLLLLPLPHHGSSHKWPHPLQRRMTMHPSLVMHGCAPSSGSKRVPRWRHPAVARRSRPTPASMIMQLQHMGIVTSILCWRHKWRWGDCRCINWFLWASRCRDNCNISYL
jgi:hypothetical protein